MNFSNVFDEVLPTQNINWRSLKHFFILSALNYKLIIHVPSTRASILSALTEQNLKCFRRWYPFKQYGYYTCWYLECLQMRNDCSAYPRKELTKNSSNRFLINHDTSSSKSVIRVSFMSQKPRGYKVKNILNLTHKTNFSWKKFLFSKNLQSKV